MIHKFYSSGPLCGQLPPGDEYTEEWEQTTCMKCMDYAAPPGASTPRERFLTSRARVDGAREENEAIEKEIGDLLGWDERANAATHKAIALIRARRKP